MNTCKNNAPQCTPLKLTCGNCKLAGIPYRAAWPEGQLTVTCRQHGCSPIRAHYTEAYLGEECKEFELVYRLVRGYPEYKR